MGTFDAIDEKSPVFEILSNIVVDWENLHKNSMETQKIILSDTNLTLCFHTFADKFQKRHHII